MRRFTIEVHSFSDVITNSSSEMFCVEDNKHTEEELEHILQEIIDMEGKSSGNGGDWSVSENKMNNNMAKALYPFLSESELQTLQKIRMKSQGKNPNSTYYTIDIDEGFEYAIDFVRRVMGGVEDN